MKLRDGREVVTHEWVEGARYNVYDCPGNGRGEGPHPILSMDVDEGVTPFMVGCPDHKLAAAQSRFYRVDAMRRPALFPVWLVWRRPTKGELKRERREGGAHYGSGGLACEWVPE